jgi:hypothetical protein
MAAIITKENYEALLPGDKLSVHWYIKTTEGYKGIRNSEGVVENYSGSLGLRIRPENISILLDPEGFNDDEYLNGGNGEYLRFKLV